MRGEALDLENLNCVGEREKERNLRVEEGVEKEIYTQWRSDLSSGASVMEAGRCVSYIFFLFFLTCT